MHERDNFGLKINKALLSLVTKTLGLISAESPFLSASVSWWTGQLRWPREMEERPAREGGDRGDIGLWLTCLPPLHRKGREIILSDCSQPHVPASSQGHLEFPLTKPCHRCDGGSLQMPWHEREHEFVSVNNRSRLFGFKVK